MTKKTTKNLTKTYTEAANDLSLIIPMDLEALCIGINPGSIFDEAPYDFAFLQNQPYLSQFAAAGAPVSMSDGVHLHWALPDSLAQGHENNGQIVFPSVPDRWLVTRIYCDPDKATKPAFSSWVIESNYYSSGNENDSKATVTIPFKGDGWEDQPWRHLGKVVTLEEWLKENPVLKAGAIESYLGTLSAVGYGLPDFAASYQNCQNVYGFNDKGSDLVNLGTPNSDKYLGYQVIGWFSDPTQDPIRQLPVKLLLTTFNDVLAKINNAPDKAFVQASYELASYILSDNLPVDAGQKLWNILKKGQYPLEIAIPLVIKSADFDKVLTYISADEKEYLETYYLGEMGLIGGLDADESTKLWDILSVAGFDFLGQVLNKAKWSMPSGTTIPDISPGFTLYSGLINNIVWNADKDYFEKKDDPSNNFNIAIGNSSSEALSALIANTSGFDQGSVAEVEEILNALQTGLLSKVKDESMLADWEELKAALHESSFGSTRGGFLWEIQLAVNNADEIGEVTLPEDLAKALNDLNISQQAYNDNQEKIISQQNQLFADWYRFMMVQYKPGGFDPSGGIDTGDLANYMTEKIRLMGVLIDDTKAIADKITSQESLLRNDLGDTYFLSQITAPRYWQPNDPVLLFQGDGIEPTDRYGNDGRYMANNTLVCRLSNQLLSNLVIPAGALGNSADVVMNSSVFSLITNSNNQPIIAALNLLLVDGALMNEEVIAAQLQLAGVADSLSSLVQKIYPLIQAFLKPVIPTEIEKSIYESYLKIISDSDAQFLNSFYTLTGDSYILNTPIDQLKDEDVLQLTYIFISVSYNPSHGSLRYTGIAFSMAGIQSWFKNPWLPFSLKWRVYFYPLDLIKPGDDGYTHDFITSQFHIGDTNLDYIGPPVTPGEAGIQQYDNTIFLTPHANINLRKQLSNFIDQYPKDPIKDELVYILGKLADKPVLSQALSGLNEALLMHRKDLQLPVADPRTGDFYGFTNEIVSPAVHNQNINMPATGYNFNPIRVGLMQIANVTLVDVFGRNVVIDQPAKIYRASSMQQSTMLPASTIYLAPRLTESSRLLFRWLSADDDTIEMILLLPQ
ncbi:MAG: hypothetical protein HYZ54_13960 [Ignavibacteriae bacterium]|nr:hypothetical protein [Ignavibacteriota bacterium]